MDIDELNIAAYINSYNCVPECPCQDVHLAMMDHDNQVIAMATLTAEQARSMAAQLLRDADRADVQRLRLEGRLA